MMLSCNQDVNHIFVNKAIKVHVYLMTGTDTGELTHVYHQWWMFLRVELPMISCLKIWSLIKRDFWRISTITGSIHIDDIVIIDTEANQEIQGDIFGQNASWAPNSLTVTRRWWNVSIGQYQSWCDACHVHITVHFTILEKMESCHRTDNTSQCVA